MNSRERFYASTHYKPFDRLFRMEMSYFEETRKRWLSEGMPPHTEMDRIFGFDRDEKIPVSSGALYGWEYETLELDDVYETYRDGDGVIKKKRRDEVPPAMPQYLDFPLKSREIWKKDYLPRLDPDSPQRFPVHWASMVNDYKNHDYPLGIHTGSIFGWIRNWMGVENLSLMLYDDYDFVKMMMDHIGDFLAEITKRAVAGVQLDYAYMWEDMCYKTASLISPKHFRELMMPNYRKITDVLHKAGVDVIRLDSDGNCDQLIPLWLEVGINFIWPMEVAAGMDVVKLRKQYGRDLLMGGGIDKRVLAQSRDAIDRMLDPMVETIQGGGYIPFCDHTIPQDVPWENYCYFRERLSDIA